MPYNQASQLLNNNVCCNETELAGYYVSVVILRVTDVFVEECTHLFSCLAKNCLVIFENTEQVQSDQLFFTLLSLSADCVYATKYSIHTRK